MSSEEKDGLDKKRIFFAEDIHYDKSWMKKVISKLSKNVYLTIDLDVFDPSVLPSTGTPEPGGLGWYDVIGLIKKINKERNIVGFDVVELCPSKEKSSDFAAAKLVYKILAYKFMEGKR
jgi:agmatinase